MVTRHLSRILLAAACAVGAAHPAAAADPTFISDETGRMLRGLPGLAMFQRDFRGDAGLEDVGCGPIAATNALVWWMSRGYDDLADGFRTSDGRINWQKLAIHLREDVLVTGAGVGVETWTLPESMENGLTRFVESQGYAVDVERKVVHRDDLTKSMIDIRNSIDAGEPIIILYDPLDDRSDTTIDGMMHYGVIVGYEGDDVFIHDGLPGDFTDRVRWNIGEGNVDLYFMRIHGSGRASSAFCVADGAPEMYLKEAPTSSTFGGSAFEDHALLVHTAGERCGVLTNATTMAIDVSDRNEGRILTPGARVSVEVSASFGGRASSFRVDNIVTWLHGPAGYVSIDSTGPDVITAESTSAVVSTTLPYDLAPGRYSLMLSVSVVDDGRRTVMQEETGTFYVFAAPAITAVPTTKTASLADAPGAWRSKSWLIQPGSGYFDARLTASAMVQVRIVEFAASGDETTVVNEVVDGSAGIRHSWVDETGTSSRLLIVEPFMASRPIDVSLTVDGEAVTILGWDTPSGHARLTASDGLMLDVGDSVDLSYTMPANSLVSATLQSTTSSLLAARSSTPGYVIEVVDVPAVVVGERLTIDAAASPHRQRSGTVVARHDGLLRSRVLFRITKTGLAAGFVLDVDVASVSSREAGSLVNSVVDPDTYLYDTFCSTRRVDGQRPADHRLVRVPAGRALRLTSTSVTRNGASVAAAAHVAQRILDTTGRSLLTTGADVVEIPAADTEQTVLVEFTGPQLLVGGTDTLQARVCVELR
jgi:hypothetical protein